MIIVTYKPFKNAMEKKITVPCSNIQPASIIFNQKEKMLGNKPTLISTSTLHNFK